MTFLVQPFASHGIRLTTTLSAICHPLMFSAVLLLTIFPSFFVPLVASTTKEPAHRTTDRWPGLGRPRMQPLVFPFSACFFLLLWIFFTSSRPFSWSFFFSFPLTAPYPPVIFCPSCPATELPQLSCVFSSHTPSRACPAITALCPSLHLHTFVAQAKYFEYIVWTGQIFNNNDATLDAHLGRPLSIGIHPKIRKEKKDERKQPAAPTRGW